MMNFGKMDVNNSQPLLSNGFLTAAKQILTTKKFQSFTWSFSSLSPLLSPVVHKCQRVSRLVITFAANLMSFLTTFLSTVIPFTVRILRDKSLLTIGPNSHSLKQVKYIK